MNSANAILNTFYLILFSILVFSDLRYRFRKTRKQEMAFPASQDRERHCEKRKSIGALPRTEVNLRVLRGWYPVHRFFLSLRAG